MSEKKEYALCKSAISRQNLPTALLLLAVACSLFVIILHPFRIIMQPSLFVISRLLNK